MAKQHTVRPIQYLPSVFVRYLKFPKSFALPWLVVSIAVLVLFGNGGLLSFESGGSETAGISYSQESSAGSSQQISISGQFSLSLSVADNKLYLQSGKLNGYSVQRGNSQNLELRGVDGSVYATLAISASGDQAESRLFDDSGRLRYKIQREDNEYKLKDAASTLLQKVKIKEEKFNLYRPDGTRILRGKEKNGGIVVRDDSDRDLAFVQWSGNLTRPLLTASYLTLSLADEYRALLFAEALLE